jgi:hypothetical protein
MVIVTVLIGDMVVFVDIGRIVVANMDMEMHMGIR